jgi:hypothetical protein
MAAGSSLQAGTIPSVFWTPKRDSKSNSGKLTPFRGQAAPAISTPSFFPLMDRFLRADLTIALFSSGMQLLDFQLDNLSNILNPSTMFISPQEGKVEIYMYGAYLGRISSRKR